MGLSWTSYREQGTGEAWSELSPIPGRTRQEAEDHQVAHTKLDPESIRKVARETALQAIDVQKTEMRALGVMADWDAEDGVYRTMGEVASGGCLQIMETWLIPTDRAFEIRQLTLFREMVEAGQCNWRSLLMSGFISHRLRPTYYSPSSRTALAEAELTYKDQHQSRSVYVAFPVHTPSEALKKASGGCSAERVKLAIWTTTPWSLPGNAGVMVNEAMSYCLVSYGDDLLVVAEERLSHLEEILGCSLSIVARLKGTC